MRLISILLFSLSLVSCMKFPHQELSLPDSPTSEKVPMWLICGELHSDFVVETAWLTKNGCKLPDSVKPYKYACFGWGDQIAYTHRWGSADVPQALLWPSKSIVQVVGFNTPVEPTFPKQESIKTMVPKGNGKALANFLNHSFTFQPNGAPITLQPAKWGHGYFIKSPYTYYLPRMCNQWTGTAFKKAGVYTCSLSPTMSAQTIKRQIRKYNKQ